MATIRYNIEMDASGNATVVQDIIQIDKNDQIVFWTTGENVPPGQVISIQYAKSPFKAATSAPQSGQDFAVTPLNTTRYPIEKSNHKDGVLADVNEMGIHFGVRRTFPFQCGVSEWDPKTNKAVKGTFQSWSSNASAGNAASHTAAATAHTAAAAAYTRSGANSSSSEAAAYTAAAAAHTAAAAAHTAAAAGSTQSGAAGSTPTGGDDGL
jgi:hypothetical protein